MREPDLKNANVGFIYDQWTSVSDEPVRPRPDKSMLVWSLMFVNSVMKTPLIVFLSTSKSDLFKSFAAEIALV